MNRTKGFTLIELMIVVAIIAILAAMAISQYQAYVNRQQGGGEGAQTGSYQPSTASAFLVCKDAAGAEVKREPTIPGERWDFEGGVYVTRDAKGNPVTMNTTGLSCVIE